MSYQLLAIKVLTGCSSNIRKCLNEDTLYFLSSSYKKDPNCNENLLKEEVSIENKSAYKDLYKVNAERKSKVDDNTAKMQSIKWLGV